MKTAHIVISAVTVAIAAATPLADCKLGYLYCFHSLSTNDQNLAIENILSYENGVHGALGEELAEVSINPAKSLFECGGTKSQRVVIFKRECEESCEDRSFRNDVCNPDVPEDTKPSRFKPLHGNW